MSGVGYHIKNIDKGILGERSKISEEYGYLKMLYGTGCAFQRVSL